MSSANSASPSHGLGTTPRSALILGALGVVYGDIGTSPLYAVRACLEGYHQLSQEHVLGVLSILFWMLMLVVSLKYMTFILRADNKGEGGTMALLELAVRGRSGYQKMVLVALGTFGAALFYGDSMITPAISVLSALEGISIVSSDLEHWVVPLAVLVLVALFSIQSRGTAVIGKLFGPIMVTWFLSLGAMGIWQIWQTPSILYALNPIWAWRLASDFPWQSFVLLGAVVLALTGAEALYADMGHFGRSAIRRAWFILVLPALTLCYFGQGALLLRDPAAIKNPFFLMAPDWALIPLVLLAAFSTVIASQAVISGAFSVTRQAVQLGFWPRMEILHTSEREEGQIYLPRVNWLLLIAVLTLVLIFRKSDDLAMAYGFAVTGTMLTTSVLAFAVLLRGATGARKIGWIAILSLLLLVDILFFSANTIKLHEGGWMPLLVGTIIFSVMMTWRNGRAILADMQVRDKQPLAEFMALIEKYPPARVDGTAIFMTESEGVVPAALLHNLKHNKVLHQQVVFLTVNVADIPYVSVEDRFTVKPLSVTSWEATVRYGFKQEPDVPLALELIAKAHPEIDLEPMRTSYFLSRQTIMVVKQPTLRSIRRRLFAFMSRSATRSTRFFKIPPNRVVEMGMQIEI